MLDMRGADTRCCLANRRAFFHLLIVFAVHDSAAERERIIQSID
jgi:hypothetical protein